MIRTSWNQDGLLQIELSVEIAQLLYDGIQPGHHVRAPELAILSSMLEDRLAKPQRRRGDAEAKD